MLLIEKILTQLKDSSSTQFLKARRFVELGNVLMVKLSDGFLMARVKDELGKIYTTHANLKHWETGNIKCMCQQNQPCVHLIAAMMAWLQQYTHHKKPQIAIYQTVKWLESSELHEDTEWQFNLSGDIQHGFQSELELIQEQEHWNLSDIIVYLLETFSYQSLLAKNDALILEIVQANGQKLRVAWWRIKWFLQKVVEQQFEIQHSKLKFGVNWKKMAQVQDWLSHNPD